METILELQDKSELITSDNHIIFNFDSLIGHLEPKKHIQSYFDYRILNYDTYISNMKRVITN